MGNEVADASVWQIRAAAWELAALSLRYPGAELAGAAAGGEWDEAAGEILAALGLPAEVPAAAGDPAGPPA
ncbi:MAG: molecular chaperone TorD, partial [Eggerthella lenta]